MRRRFLVLLVCVLPATAHADRHKKGFRVAAVDAKRSSLWGWQGSTEFPLARKELKPACCCCTQAAPDCCPVQGSADAGREGPAHPADTREPRTLSAVLEGSIVAGEHKGQEVVQITYLSGLRYAFNRPFRVPIEVFVQALVGGSHDNLEEIPDQPLATAGLGLYVPIRHWWGISVEVDRSVLLAGAKEWYTEISVGLVWRLDK